MKTSPNGVRLIKGFESFRAKAYLCPANVWTIGYGSTEGVFQGQTITEPEASALLMKELQRYERAVDFACDANQNEFDAFVSLSFNIGIAGFQKSTVLKAHKRGDHESAARAFAMWNKGGGKVLPGLVRRRAAEAALYLTSVPDDVSDAAEVPGMPQKVDAPKPLTASKINLAQAGTATIATVTGATEVLKTVGDFQESVQAIGPWLVPIACVAVVALCLFTIWQRYDLRTRGVV